ncbi:MAG TPA: SulP family inorganic anion transporter [Sporichthya sp.]|nr:SulP family inorganic anion transporter [Sporichthya sp.]
MRLPQGFTGDLVAGLSVAVVAIPQSLAYADLAGMPAVSGLYATALPPLVAALFASSPYLMTGPVAVTALLTYGALSSRADPGSPEYMRLGLALALIVGVVRIALGLLRAGWVAYLMSHPVLLGFVPAAALLIATSQTPKGFGVEDAPDYDNQVFSAVWALGHPGHWQAAPMIVAGLTVAVIVLGRRIHVLFPGVLISAVAATAIAAAGGYSGTQIDDIPAGLPPITVDDLPWSDVPSLALAGLVIALVGFTEAASISRRFAAQDRTRWDADREFVSQGAANVAAAFSGGFPCGGSFSRSAVARVSGARTRLAGAITGITVLLFLPFAHILEPMPEATLAGIVISAVFGLLRFRAMWALWRISVPQAVIAWGTFAATLLLAPRIDIAVLIGIGGSLAVFLARALRLDVDVSVLETSQGTLLTLTPRGILWFGTAQRLDVAVSDALEAHPGMWRVEFDLSGLGRIDTTGALVLRSALAHARAIGLEAEITRVPPQSAALTARILAAGDELD